MDLSMLNVLRQARAAVVGVLPAAAGVPVLVRNDCDACAIGGTVVIGPRFLAFVGDPFGAGFIRRQHLFAFLVGVLAHEVGHTLSGHTSSTHRNEHEADAIAGWVLGRLCLPIEPLGLFLMKQFESPSHPDGTARLRVLQTAWAEGRFFSGGGSRWL